MNQDLKNIATQIIREIPSFKSYYLEASKDEEGRVTIPIETNGNELQFVGITDNEGDFFYIRFREEWTLYEEVSETKRFSSCESFIEQRIPFRIVVVSDCLNPKEVESIIANILISYKVQRSGSIKFGRTILRQSTTDSITILKEEAKAPKKFDKNLRFVAIDFDLITEIQSSGCSSHVIFNPGPEERVFQYQNGDLLTTQNGNNFLTQIQP